MTQSTLSPAKTRERKSSSRRAMLGGGKLLAYQLGLFACLLLIWEGAVRIGWAKAYIYGQPSGILTKLLTLLDNGQLLTHTVITAQEAILGFVIGSFFGSASGLLLWLVPNVARVLRPILVALNGVPKIALAPLIIVWFGVGIEAKIAIAASLTFIVSLITTYAGVGQVDDDLIRLMRSLGATRMQIWSKIIVPASVPWIVSALRLNIGFALIGAVVGEYISAKEGLGYLVYYSGVLYDLNSVWVGIFALMALALVLDQAINQIERRVAWK